MGSRNPGCRGLVWGLSNIAVLFGVVLLFTILWTLYLNILEVNAVDSAVWESRNIARILDEIGSSPSYCEVGYKLPDRLSGRGYGIRIVPGKVVLSLYDSGVNYTASFTSDLGGNFSAAGGAGLRIKNQDRFIEIS